MHDLEPETIVEHDERDVHYVEEVIARLDQLAKGNLTQRDIIAWTRKEILESPEEDEFKPPTIDPTLPGNTSYERTEEVHVEDFLRQRLHGRIVDIGSGGINELDGVVPADQVTYVDRMASDQENFIQCDVGKEPLPISDESIDGVFTRNTFHSPESAEAILKESMRILRPDGTLVAAFMYSIPELKKVSIATARALRLSGIDMDQAVDVQVVNTAMKHEKYPLTHNQPTVYFTVTKQSEPGSKTR